MVRMNRFSARIIIMFDTYEWFQLLNRAPCHSSIDWRVGYVMVDLVMQWLGLVISMEIHLKVSCNIFYYSVLLICNS